jgi:hypothetical protein
MTESTAIVEFVQEQIALARAGEIILSASSRVRPLVDDLQRIGGVSDDLGPELAAALSHLGALIESLASMGAVLEQLYAVSSERLKEASDG